MEKTVIALFDTSDQASSTINALIGAGFPPNNIRAMSTEQYAKEFGAGKIEPTKEEKPSGIKGFLADIGLLKSHRNYGMSESEAKTYERHIQSGKTMVLLECDDSLVSKAAQIMETHGARNLDEDETRRTAAAAATAATTATTGTTTTGREARVTGTIQGQTKVPVVQEEVAIGKQQELRGGVRVFTRTVERPVERDVRLREEHAHVERRPVDRPATAQDLRTQGETVEVLETAEVPVVAKRARVIEEVIIGKEVRERTEHITETARGTEVEVQPIGAASLQPFSAYEADFRTNHKKFYERSGHDYDTWSPAYKYGYDLASLPTYRNRDWAAIEGDARTMWEQRNPGTWDNYKDAIRYSYDRVRTSK